MYHGVSNFQSNKHTHLQPHCTISNSYRTK